jgi:hypothetical protein
VSQAQADGTPKGPTFSLERLDAGVLIRALAISWVVLNHALSETETYGFSIAGGMSFLLFYSGYNFARFALADKDAVGIRRSLRSTIWKFLVPSVALIFVSSVWRGDFNVLELLHISNFVSHDKVAYFPVWYVEVIVQISLILVVAFSIPPIYRAFRSHPLIFSSLLVAVSVAGIKLLNFDYLVDERLPWFYIWLFALGWVVFFAARLTSSQVPERGKVLASVALIATVYFVYGATPQVLRPLWPICGGLLLIWFPIVLVPAAVKTISTVVARATQFIFFLHAFIFGALGLLAERLSGSKDVNFVLRWAAAMLVCVLLWAAWTAFIRTYRAGAAHVRQKSAAHSGSVLPS